jgi:hypothetical protein
MRYERVLITGGLDFIDSNPAETLAEENDVYWALTEAYPMALITLRQQKETNGGLKDQKNIM